MVHIMLLTSWSKKNNTVMISPGTIARNIQPIESSQNGTKKVLRSGLVGRKEVLTASVSTKGGKLSDVWRTDEYNDTYGCSVFCKAHSNVVAEEGPPVFSR